MRETVRHQLLIAAVAVAVFFTNLGAARLWDQDEAFFARTAVEMQQRNDWIVPYFNGEVFAHKPPFMFWMMRASFAMFGNTEFAARFWSAVFSTASALLVYQIGRRMFSTRVGLWAGLAMGTAIMLDVVGRAATADSFLVFFCTLAMYLFVRAEDWCGTSELNGKRRNLAIPLRIWIAIYTTIVMSVIVKWPIGVVLPGCLIGLYLLVRDPMWGAIYAAMGMAVMVKGPIGVVLPGCVIGLYLLVRDPIEIANQRLGWSDRAANFLKRFAPLRVGRVFLRMQPLVAIAAVLLIAGPWYVLVGLRTGGSFLSQFFGEQNVGRFFNAMDNHSGGIWYYIPAVLVGFFPWSIFTIPMIINLVRDMRAGSESPRGAKFLACWAVVWIGFFSLASTKLPNYVLPAYPALALATACLLARWQEQLARSWWPQISFGSLTAVGLVMAIVAPVAVFVKFGEQTLLEKAGISQELTSAFAHVGWLGVVLTVGGAACIVLILANRPRGALATFAITAPTFCLGLFAVLAIEFDRYQPVPAIATSIHRFADGSAEVAQFGFFRPSLIYYSDTRVDACKTVPSVLAFFDRSKNAFLVTTDEHYRRLAAELPGDVVVLDRQPEFPREGNVIVLGRQPKVALHGETAKN
jgi:4-amino-4-deoxy-L-arabinose transferase-like glycosyltransferase